MQKPSFLLRMRWIWDDYRCEQDTLSMMKLGFKIFNVINVSFPKPEFLWMKRLFLNDSFVDWSLELAIHKKVHISYIFLCMANKLFRMASFVKNKPSTPWPRLTCIVALKFCEETSIQLCSQDLQSTNEPKVQHLDDRSSRWFIENCRRRFYDSDTNAWDWNLNFGANPSRGVERSGT